MASQAIDPLTASILTTQQDMFRLAQFDHGLSRKEISSKSGINYDTLGTYARGETPMPITALVRLCEIVPDYLLSRLFDPAGRHIAKNEEETNPLDLIERGVAMLKGAAK